MVVVACGDVGPGFVVSGVVVLGGITITGPAASAGAVAEPGGQGLAEIRIGPRGPGLAWQGPPAKCARPGGAEQLGCRR